MSFFNRIVNKITGRNKKAQGIGQGIDPSGYTTVDEHLVDPRGYTEEDKRLDAEPQVQPQPQMGSFSDVQIQMIVSKAREFLEKVNPADPLNSNLPAFPEHFKHPQIKPIFIQSANWILGKEMEIDQVIIDELIEAWYQPQVAEPQVAEPQVAEPQVAEPDDSLKLQMMDYARSIDPNNLDQIDTVDGTWLNDANVGLFQSVLKEILSTEKNLGEREINEVIRSVKETYVPLINDPRLTEEIRRKVPKDIVRRIENGNIANRDAFFQGIEELDARLGEGSYTINERVKQKIKSKTNKQQMDKYPVKWISPEAHQFFDAYLKKGSGVDESKTVGEVKKYLKSKNEGSEVIGQDVENMVWESMNTLDNIGLGRTQRFDPNTGQLSYPGKGPDYLINFFLKYPQYLPGGPGGISKEYVEQNKKSWELRDKLSGIIRPLISNKNSDVLEYVMHLMGKRIATLISDRKDRDQLSYDIESDTGKAVIDILDAKGGFAAGAGAQVDRTSDEYQKAVNVVRWQSIQQYASTENGGTGNILREVNDNIGKPVTDSLSEKIGQIASGELAVKDVSKEILRYNLLADTIQSLMLMGISQVDTLFKEVHESYNEEDPNSIRFRMDDDKKRGIYEKPGGLVNGQVFLNMDGSGIDKWNKIVSGGSLYNVMSNIAKAKGIISKINTSQTGSDPKRIAQAASTELQRQGITAENNPIVHSMLQDEEFVKRSRAISPNLVDSMYIRYKVPPPNVDKLKYKKLKKSFNNVINISHNYFIEPTIEAVINEEANIRQMYKDDPKTMDSKLTRLDEMKKVFSSIIPTHVEYKWSQEQRDKLKETIEQQKEQQKIEKQKIEKQKKDGVPKEDLTPLTKIRRAPLGLRNKNIHGQDYNVSQWWKALMGVRDKKGNLVYPIPRKTSPKVSEQFINGLYKSGNSILAELVKAQQMLDGFGLGEEVIKTINKVGDDYRNRIESLRD